MSDSERDDQHEDPQEDRLSDAEVTRIAERNERNARQAERRRRGRQPAINPTRVRELRLTPPDGEPVQDWYIDSNISKLLACEEGGIGTGKALHYHAVIETTYSDDSIKGWIRRVLRVPMSQALGNAVYRTGAPHENTYQYVVKCEKVVESHGHTPDEIREWIRLSDEYRRDIGAQRRALQRLRSQGREKQLRTVEEITFKWAADNVWATGVDNLVRRLLTECDNGNIEFPTRAQMEAMVNRIQWKLAKLPSMDERRTATLGDRVVEYYTRGLAPRTNFS